MKSFFRRAAFSALAAAALPISLEAWGAQGHEIVNQLALASLPGDFPSWVRSPANVERIRFLANEPDRWRDSTDRVLLHAASLEHSFNWEEITDAGMDFATLSQFRYDFTQQFGLARAAHEGNFRPLEPKYNANHTENLPGFLPWAIAEYYGKLEVVFSYLKVYERYGTAAEVENARANAIEVMGLMGHFVGDGCQPLHITKYFYGWTGANPHGYVNRAGWHAWIDSGFIDRAGITTQELLPQVRTATPLAMAPSPDGRDPGFVATLGYLQATNQQLIPLYQLEKDGPLRMGGSPTAEGRAWIDAQLLRGGEMLGSLWLTAWRQAKPDHYLQSTLTQKKRSS